MPPLLDKPHIPSGVSECCLYNSHTECRAPACNCSCHKSIVNSNIPPVEAGPEKACPKCGTKRPFSETFCRLDGERLASLLCGMCGKGMNPEDSFCYNCGAPKGTVGVVKLPQVVVGPPLEQEIDYTKQVLDGVQRELEGANGHQGEVGNEGPTQRVVEEPMGQGSFRLVSAPSPNKIRVPLKGPAIKLPVKPT